MNFNANLLSLIIKEDRLVAKRILKAMALNIALEVSKGNEVSIEYLGTFKKKGRYWSFTESEYLKTIRYCKMTPLEFLDSILTEDDQISDKLPDSNIKPELDNSGKDGRGNSIPLQ